MLHKKFGVIHFVLYHFYIVYMCFVVPLKITMKES